MDGWERVGKNDLITGLDIGTTKVCALIAELDEQGQVLIIGMGIVPSTGMKKGVVVDIEATTRAVEEAVGIASRQANRDVDAVYVGVTGEHIASLNSSARVAITSPDREITHGDVQRVLESARVIVLPPDRQIIHSIPRSYAIDGQDGVKQPIGMSGSRLEVETHIIHGTTTFLNNVEKCVEKAGLEIVAPVLEPIATAEAVLMEAEKELGVCLVDIGGGTSDLAVFIKGEIFYSSVIPVGGNHVTNDVAFGLTVGRDEAERLKTESGNALLELVSEEDVIAVRQVGREEARSLRRTALVQIIEPRMQELFQLVKDELDKAECLGLTPAGLVISGGGSQLEGCVEVARQVMNMPVRIGSPQGIGAIGETLTHPRYATAIGLVLYGAKQIQAGRQPQQSQGFGGAFSFVQRFLDWLRDRFGTH